MATQQVAIKLDSHAFEALKRIAAADRASYATVITHALAAWENNASPPLAPASDMIIYGQLSNSDRETWRQKVRELRTTGLSQVAIGKRLYREYRLATIDGLPLSGSTIRGMLAL